MAARVSEPHLAVRITVGRLNLRQMLWVHVEGFDACLGEPEGRPMPDADPPDMGSRKLSTGHDGPNDVTGLEPREGLRSRRRRPWKPIGIRSAASAHAVPASTNLQRREVRIERDARPGFAHARGIDPVRLRVAESVTDLGGIVVRQDTDAELFSHPE